MIAALVSNIVLTPHLLFSVTIFLQVFFYSLAIWGAKVPGRKSIVFTAPRYFVSINLALLFGFFRFITGTQRAAWKRTAR